MGYFILFKTAQIEMKEQAFEQIKQGLFKNPLSIITINKNELSKIELEEGGKEIRYNNDYYDIVKVTETNESISYHCINDNNETQLLSNFEEHINTSAAGNAPLKSNPSKNLSNNVIKLYFSNEAQLFSFYGTSSNIIFNSFNSIYSAVSLKTDSPPPELV